MSSSIATKKEVKHVAGRRLWWVGLLAMVVSLIVNLAVLAITGALTNIPTAFMPLAAGPIITFTIFGTIGATFVFAVIGRFSRRPIWLFKLVALIVFIVTLIPDFFFFSGVPFPDGNIITIGALMLTHVTTAIICVGLFTTLGVESSAQKN